MVDDPRLLVHGVKVTSFRVGSIDAARVGSKVISVSPPQQALERPQPDSVSVIPVQDSWNYLHHVGDVGVPSQGVIGAFPLESICDGSGQIPFKQNSAGQL